VTFTVNDGTTTASATRGIAITAVNDPPVNLVPGAQGTAQDTRWYSRAATATRSRLRIRTLEETPFR
jgi:hypothetical protein